MSNSINYQELYNILNNNNTNNNDNKIDYLINQIDFHNIYMTNKEFNEILNFIATNDKQKLLKYIKYIKLIKSMHNLEF